MAEEVVLAEVAEKLVVVHVPHVTELAEGMPLIALFIGISNATVSRQVLS